MLVNDQRKRLSPLHFGLKPKMKLDADSNARPDLVKSLETVILDYVETALILCLGQRNLTAAKLGISVQTLRTYIERIKLRDADDSIHSTRIVCKAAAASV